MTEDVSGGAESQMKKRFNGGAKQAAATWRRQTRFIMQGDERHGEKEEKKECRV